MCMADPDGCYWEFESVTNPKARKEHRCEECRRTIYVGETYQRFGGKSEGYLRTYTTCAHCEVAISWLLEACQGYIFSAVLEDLREHWDEHDLYRSDMLRSLIDGIESGWHNGADPVPDVEAVRASVPSPSSVGVGHGN